MNSLLFFGIIDWLKKLPARLGQTISYMIENLFYSIFKAIALVCDWVEALFKAFCGLLPVEGSDELSYDPATILLTNKTVQSVFTSLLILGIIVLFITTFVAIIKTEFNSFSTGNSKTKVLGKAGKAIVNLITIPVCCILGVMMSNVLLRTVHDALNRGSNSTLATQVFVASNYSANWARVDKKFVMAYNSGYNNMGVLNESTYPGFEYADMIDAAFLNNLTFQFPDNAKFVVTNDFDKVGTLAHNEIGLYVPFDNFYIKPSGVRKALEKEDAVSFSIYNSKMVMSFYNIEEFGLSLLSNVTIVIVAYNLLMMILGLVKRLFDIGLYYLISPPIIALYPIDDGEGLKNWKIKFISATLSAYGGLVAIDMFIVLLPIICTIDFVAVLGITSGILHTVLTQFLKLLIVVSGTNFLKSTSKDVMKMLAGKEAGGGALADGAGAMDAIKKTAGKVFKIAMAAVKVFGGLAGGALAILTQIGKVGAKQAFKNFANKQAKNVINLGKQMKSAITNKPVTKGSDTPLSDAANFFKTGTANKERQQAILSLQHQRKQAGKFLEDYGTFDKDGNPVASSAKGQEMQRRIDELSGKSSLSKREQKELDRLNAQKDTYKNNAKNLEGSKALQHQMREAQNVMERTKSMPKNFLALRSLDRATGSGSNIENVRGNLGLHEASEAIHNEGRAMSRGHVAGRRFTR